MKAHNIKTYADLEAYYIRRVVGIAGTVESKRKDGTSVVWQDVFDNKGVSCISGSIFAKKRIFLTSDV